MRGKLNNDIHQSSRHDNDLAYGLAIDKTPHVLVSKRQIFDELFRCIYGNRQSTAQLTIDLHNHFDAVDLERAFVDDRPAPIDQRRLVAKFLPERVANMRHDR